MKDKCKFLPKDSFPVCEAGSEIGFYKCTRQDELTCPWTKERRKKMNETAENKVMEDTPKSICTFYIAGVQHHHEYKSILNDVTEGDNLSLEPELDPKILRYDPNAVRIYFDNSDKRAWLGFVPKKFSSEVSGLLEIGKRLECVLTSFNRSAPTWEMFKVEIKEIEEE